MGCLCSCMRGYKQIPNTDDNNFGTVQLANVSTPRYIQQSVHFPQEEEALNEFDLKSNINKGSEVELKFTKNHTYSSKFIWITVETRKIHMSDYTNKTRSHKEANLDHVSSITAGPPAKYKKANKNDVINGKLCLTINFIQKGAGIDLKFLTETERDIWYNELNHVLSNYPTSLVPAQ